jgi:copper(I)-binding protein
VARLQTIFAASLALAVLGCSASDESPADIAVSNGWTREIAPGQSAAAIYLTIANRGEGGDRLVTVAADQGKAALHSNSSADGVARMRPLADGLKIPPRSTVALKPGGTHIMLTGLKQPLRRGEAIGLTLGFERSGQRPITIRVIEAGGEAHSSHGMTM